MASSDLLPKPPHEADRQRWEVTARRVRMVDGLWLPDAEEWIAGWFAAEIVANLPRPELSHNPLLSLINQVGTLYDRPYRVSVLDEKGKPIEGMQGSADGPLLAQQQDLLRYVLACNDAVLRMDVDADTGEVSYRVVTADMVWGEADPKRPDQPAMIEELRLRTDKSTGNDLWTWERWDVRGPQPEFKIFQRRDNGDEIDLTEEYAGAAGWPKQYDPAAGIPYVLYHRFVAPRLWSPEAGAEVVAGTLTTSALWTAWLAGYRDGGFPTRLLFDAEIQGGTVQRMMGNATQMHVANPMAILRVKSNGEARQGSAQTWDPTMDPKTSGEAAAAFEAGLAVMAGLSPADVTTGANGASGYSIVVSRDGQRRMQAKLRIPMAQGDQLRLSKVAAYVGGDLPTDPTRYSVTYAPIPKSPEEVTAELAEIERLLDLGLITRREAYMRSHPDATEEQAVAALEEIEAERKARADEQAARMAKAAPTIPPKTADPKEPTP